LHSRSERVYGKEEIGGKERGERKFKKGYKKFG
jgi:hypothetical protein